MIRKSSEFDSSVICILLLFLRTAAAQLAPYGHWGQGGWERKKVTGNSGERAMGDYFNLLSFHILISKQM